MIDMEFENQATLAGVLDERPDFSESETGIPMAMFLIRCGSNVAQCIASGPVAESLQRYGRGGCEVLAVGRLDWLCDADRTQVVQVDRLAFTNPTEVAELTGVAS